MSQCALADAAGRSAVQQRREGAQRRQMRDGGVPVGVDRRVGRGAAGGWRAASAVARGRQAGGLHVTLGKQVRLCKV